MNLNISTQFTNNCLGNNVSKENVTNNTEFTDLIKELSCISEEVDVNENLDTTNSEDKKDIDYNFLLSILNNIQTLDNLNNANISDKIELEITSKPESLDETLNVKTNNSQSLDLEKLNNIVLNQELNIEDLSKSNTVLLNLINENLQNKSIKDNQDTDSELVHMGNNLSKDNNLENKNIINKALDNLDLENKPEDNIQVENLENNSLNKANEEIKKENAYEELENSVLINKNNIIKNTNVERNDKDLNILESVLDNNDNNSFINLNNINSNASSIVTKEDVNQINASNIRQEFMEEDIIKNIKYMKSNGLEEIKIKLTPKELGDMTIKLIKNLEETKVHIIIDKDDVFNLVNKNVNDISKHLKSLDINVKEISVDIKSNNEKFFSDNLNQEFNKRNQQNKKQRNRFVNIEVEPIEELKEGKILESNLNILI